MYKMNNPDPGTAIKVPAIKVTDTLTPATVLAGIRDRLGVKVSVTLIALGALPGMVMAQALPEKDAYVHEGVATCAASQCHGSAVPRVTRSSISTPI